MGESHGRHGVTQEPVDTPDLAEPVEPTPVERLQATRNRLLRVLRCIDGLKVAARAGKPPQGEPRAVQPASYFVGPEVETDLERVTEALERSVEELAGLLGESR